MMHILLVIISPTPRFVNNSHTTYELISKKNTNIKYYINLLIETVYKIIFL